MGPRFRYRRLRIGTALLLLALTATGGLERSYALDTEESPVIVVVHESVPTRDLDMDDLRQLVLGSRRFWPGGERVELILESGATPGRRAFVRRLSGMSELQFQQYWIGQVFNQRATRAPRAAPDRRLALAMVSAIPGAMTLVVDGPLPPRTRLVTIKGLAPDHPDYPLR